MSRRDPGAATGTAVREPGRCRCGHLEGIHSLIGSRRTGCSSSTCNCKRYDPAADTPCCREEA